MLIARPEEPYRLWYVVVCDIETSVVSRPWPALGRSDKGGRSFIYQPLSFRQTRQLMPYILESNPH